MLNSKYKIISFICCAFVCAFLGLGLSKDSVYASSNNVFGTSISVPYYAWPDGYQLDIGGLAIGASQAFDGIFSIADITSIGRTYLVFASNTQLPSNFSLRCQYTGYSNNGSVTNFSSIDGLKFYYQISSFPSSVFDNVNLPRFTVSSISDIPEYLLSNNEATLDENLGLLDVYKTHRRNLTTSTGNQHVYNRLYDYYWRGVSTTGFRVTDNGVNVDQRFQVVYTSKSQNNTIKFLSDIESISGQAVRGTFDTNDMYNQATNVLDFYNSDSVFSRGSIGLDFFVRINDTNTNTVGKWLRLEWNISEGDFIDGKNPTNQESGHFDEDDNWIPDDDSDLPDIDNTDGSGDTPEDADDNADKNEDNSDIHVPSPDDFGDIDFSDIVTGIKGALSSFISTVTSFISLVSATLSFLPKWVINFFALSIAIWCIMLIKRAIF